MKTVIKIFERSDVQYPYNGIKRLWKIKRGWIQIVEFGVRRPYYCVIWSLRKTQQYCEILQTFYSDSVSDSDLKIAFERAIDFVLTAEFVLSGKRTRKNKTVRDSQRAKVYNWERDNLDLGNQPTLTSNEMTTFLKMIASQNDVKLKTIKFRGGGACSFARGVGELAFLPVHMNKPIACHEIAHLVINNISSTFAGHGPEWVRVYVDFLVKYCGFNELTLLASLRKSRIKIGSVI